MTIERSGRIINDSEQFELTCAEIANLLEVEDNEWGGSYQDRCCQDYRKIKKCLMLPFLHL